MHTTMANENYEKDWKKFLKCKECWEFKELNEQNWYKHYQWFMWVLWRCKECIKGWRKSEHEIMMARKCDYNRYHNNCKRRENVKNWTRMRTKKHLEINPNWTLYHERAQRKINKLWIRPSKCPICWYSGKIIAHHPDINEWNKIVFCCQPCHSKIHMGKINCPKALDLLVNNI